MLIAVFTGSSHIAAAQGSQAGIGTTGGFIPSSAKLEGSEWPGRKLAQMKAQRSGRYASDDWPDNASCSYGVRTWVRNEGRYQWKVGRRMEHVLKSSDHRRVYYHEPNRAYRLIWKALKHVPLESLTVPHLSLWRNTRGWKRCSG